jgi:pyridoxal phosphate enzyme (YggS family)
MSATTPDSRWRELLKSRLDQVEGRIQAACQRAGRPRSGVTLVAVTKTVSAEVAALLPELGLLDLGESRPQELWHKAALLPPVVRWHQIGHLQRNKVERTLPLTTLIHSVDSERLLTAIEEEARRQTRTVEVLLEVNASHESSKHGIDPADLPLLGTRVEELKHVRVVGLMTMAALTDNAEQARPTFITLRRLRDWLQKESSLPESARHLSMGMTNDFEVAIEEGATLVRIGTALFEGMP